MPLLFSTVVLLLDIVGSTQALLHPGMIAPRVSFVSNNLRPAPRQESPTYNSTFEQPIDHWNGCAGNFSQRYWYNAQYWGGPGYPIVFMNSGEESGDNQAASLNDAYLWGSYAKELKAAMVLLEHRFWGNSVPYDVLDAHALRYLTVDQAIADFARFAQVVDLPFDTNHSSNAPNAPWVFIGGSYQGMLAAWTGRFYPGVFWAFHASSAPVQIISDFWEYWIPVQQGLPQNCSQDLQRIAAYVDDTIARGNQSAIAQLKESFAMTGSDDGDFAVALEAYLPDFDQFEPIGGFSFLLYAMCDSIEGAAAANASTIPESGVGLEVALANYAAWFRNDYIPMTCRETSGADCFNTYNVSQHSARQWMWLSCNEPTFWSFKVAPPYPQPSIISRLVSYEYYEGLCARYFPPAEGYRYGAANGRSADTVNTHTSGWDYTNTTRLIWSNGEHDPWRMESVSSPLRPGGPLNSTDQVPIFLIPGGYHASDLLALNGDVNPDIKAVQDQEVAIIARWVAEFYVERNGTANAAS